MRRYIRSLILFISSAFVSCEKTVDFPAEESGRIYVNALVKDNGQSRIDIGIAKPIGAEDNAYLGYLKLVLEADGKPVELTPDPVNSGNDMLSYTTDAVFSPGQKLTLQASCGDLPSVHAEAAVPARIPEVKILKGESQSYKNDGAGMDTDELKTLWVFTAQIDESPDDETCFGMQVLKRKVFEYEGNVPDHEREMLEKEELIEQTDDLYVNGLLPDNGELSSIDPEMVVDFDGGETFISRSKGNYGKATVSAMVEPTKRTILSSGFDALTGLSYAVYQSYEYRIRLYRISAETYDYLAARYVGKNSFLPVYMGFTPPVYVYTNVSGGAGMFGTASTYESEWVRY